MMIITNNQKPSLLNSFYLGSLAADFDPFATIRNEVVKPLFAPIVPTSAVTIKKDNKDLFPDQITSILLNCCGDTVDPESEDCMKEIFGQTLIYYDKSLSVQNVYAVQAGKKLNMLMPSARVSYTPADVIDASKRLLADQASPEEFFATLTFYTRIAAFGYYFANEQAWDDFKSWFANEVNNISSLLSTQTMMLCSNLQTIKLNSLTEGFVLRDDTDQNNEPYSFARLFVFYLMLYEQTMKQSSRSPSLAGHLPFSFAENFCPTAIIIVNVEKHAHARPNDIKKEWDIVKDSLLMKPKILSLNRIQSLTALTRMANKMKALNALSQSNKMARSAVIKFRKTPPTSVELYGYIKKIYRHASFVQNSENAVKYKKFTYQRPSRREPDNPDRQGLTSTVKFKPDLHIYLDTSGSITERNYQDAMKACIKLAKKLNINLYFSSFSHIMSKDAKLPVKDKTTKEIYEIFKSIPKVGGGTDYEQIWHYINKSAVRRKRVSLIISDFEYTAPNHYVSHPRFLFYAPISAENWKRITSCATRFAKSMLSICQDIRKHILM